MIQIKETCTGCMACRNICPAGAIGQEKNQYGFVMPIVHPKRCIHCGRCEMVCPLLRISRAEKELSDNEASGNEMPEGTLPLRACAAYHRDPRAVELSSSGGAFYALATRVLQRGGIVFGCYYDVKHKTAYLTDTDHMSLERLLTSKYVESYIGDRLKRVKKQLETGREVLFCGTPCQAAGLVSFLGRPYENLLTVDFTCGAVAAQSVLRDYLLTLEKRYHSPIRRISFRDKQYGWGQYGFLAEFQNGRIWRKTAMSDPYFFCFLRSSMQRLSCHGCQFSDRHFSDLILSDFWKCGDFGVEQNDRRGLSLVLAMTPKGLAALYDAGKLLHLEDVDVSEASYNLKPRVLQKEKLPEIRADQACAHQEGAAVLRRRLLTPQKRLYFALRQFIMDRPRIAKHCPSIVGTGQLMIPEAGRHSPNAPHKTRRI